MSGEYFSRFFVKFAEIIGAGLASAVFAYGLAHFGGIRASSSTPTAPAVAPSPGIVQVDPAASELATSLHYPVTPPVAAGAASEPRPAAQDSDASVAQAASKGVKDVKTTRPRQHTKTDIGTGEKKSPGQRSAESLARAALANVDASTPAPAEAPVAPGMTDTRPAPADLPPRQADVQSRSVDFPPRPPMPVGMPSPQ